MARLHFRVVNIHLDEEEEVSSVWAVARDDTVAVIEGLVGAVERVGEPRRGGTESTIHLPHDEMVELFRKAGKFAPIHDEHKHTREIYESLSFIVYGLMERD